MKPRIRQFLILFVAITAVTFVHSEETNSTELPETSATTSEVEFVDETTDPIVSASTTQPEEDYEPFSDEPDGAEVQPVKQPRDAVEFMEYFEELVKTFRGKLQGVFEQYMPRIFELSSSVVLSPDCTYDVVRVLFALRDMKPWAVKLLDASGKVPDGIMYGTFSSLGAYDECLETQLGDEKKEPTEDRVVTGKYCSIDIKPYLPPKPHYGSLNQVFNDAADAKGYPKEDHFSRLAPLFYYLKFRLGVCIPSSCSKDDLKAITMSLSNRIKLNVSVENCEVREPMQIGSQQAIAGGILLAVAIVIICATLTDIYRRLNSERVTAHISIKLSGLRKLMGNLIKGCSAFYNSSKILSSKVPPDSVQMLYGLKVLSLSWVILAHAYLTLDLKAMGALMRTREVSQHFWFQVVINASLAIETFFFISGLLVTLAVFRRLKINPAMGFKDWVALYVHRIVRMTPAVMLVIAFVLAAYQATDGPLWREIIYPAAERCRNNWWIHLLHISNFFDVSRMCFLHLWYISADMQLFAITPFILLLLFRKPFVGKCVLGGLTLASIVSTGLVTFINQLPPTLMFDSPDPLSRKPFGNEILVKPYPHAAPYFIGMLVGYLIHHGQSYKTSRRVAGLGWAATIAVCLCFTFITYEWNRGNHPSPFMGAIYAAAFRPMWALAMAWLVLTCHYGRGGIVNTILSWPAFVPMARCSYVAYLIHPGLMYIFVASTRGIFMFSHYLVLYLFLSHLIATFVVSFFLTLIIESPFLGIERAFIKYLKLNRDDKKRNSKYFYSVNSQFARGAQLDLEPSGPKRPVPLTEKYSISSVDSNLGLINTDSEGSRGSGSNSPSTSENSSCKL